MQDRLSNRNLVKSIAFGLVQITGDGIKGAERIMALNYEELEYRILQKLVEKGVNSETYDEELAESLSISKEYLRVFLTDFYKKDWIGMIVGGTIQLYPAGFTAFHKWEKQNQQNISNNINNLTFNAPVTGFQNQTQNSTQNVHQVNITNNPDFNSAVDAIVSLITDPNRPNFSGAKSNTNGPPGGNHPINGNSLTGGADKKWDNSRQIRFKILNPNNISASDTTFVSAFPSDLTNYPLDDFVGNDDITTTDPETNDPYSNNGVLTGHDVPITAICDRAGAVGDTFESRLHFREFTRLEIEGTWHRISDFYPWRFHRKLKKVSGGWWADDNSILALDNSGF
ncbi:MAG TPA: hypothetical protein VF571_08735 [Pyrinomonadaceae bacterium]